MNLQYLRLSVGSYLETVTSAWEEDKHGAPWPPHGPHSRKLIEERLPEAKTQPFWFQAVTLDHCVRMVM